MYYKISKEFAQKIMNYLAIRPFNEVLELVQELQKLEEIKGDDNDEKGWQEKDGKK